MDRAEGRPGRVAWLPTLARAQVSNAAAERLGKAPFPLCALVLLANIALNVFPVANDRFRTAFASADAARYPEIALALRSVAGKGWDLRAGETGLVSGPGVPAVSRIGSWTVVVEPAGGSMGDAHEGQDALGTTKERILFLGRTAITVLDERTGNRLDGSWEGLAGFSFDALAGNDGNDKVTMFLYSAATGGLARVSAAISLLMGSQIAFMTLLLGFLLSLSKVKAAGSGLSALRAAGFAPSLRSAIGVGLGPSLLVAAVLWAFPRWSQFGWTAFTLLYGARIVFLYMGRFGNKKSIEVTRRG